MIAIDTSDIRSADMSGTQSAKSSGMVSDMTRTPSSLTAGVTMSPVPTDSSPGDGAGSPSWFLAECHRCGENLAEPFLDEDARDDWAAAHVRDTGHIVFICTDGAAFSRVIRPEPGQGFKFFCTNVGATCASWNGPFGSPQVAIASARAHRCEPVR